MNFCFQGSTCLKTLNLANNEISNLSLLADALQDISCLSVLDLSRNDISVAEKDDLARAACHVR